MKIISNYKDYYDYLQGIYGVDEKVVYERVCMTDAKGKWDKSGMMIPDWVKYTKPDYVPISGWKWRGYDFNMVAVCGIIYCSCWINGKFYFNEEDCKAHIHEIKLGEFEKINDVYAKLRDFKYHLQPTEINDEKNIPVIWVSEHYSHKIETVCANPRLTDFGINQLVGPHDMYIKISNFLSREKPVVDNRTNEQKITSKGFDKKTSFRKM